MAQQGLVPCLIKLRSEFDEIAPNRSKSADGWVGDAAHQARTSDHNWDETGAVPVHDADKVNEVHALDITTELNEPGLTMEKVVQFALGRCRRSAGDPLNEDRLRYIIFNRRIWRAPDWKQEAYTLSDPHTGHAHFSASYVSSLEASTASWHLEDIPVSIPAAQMKELKDHISKEVRAVVDDRRDGYAKASADETWGHEFDRVDPKPGQTPKVTAGAILQFLEQNLQKAAEQAVASALASKP